MGSPRGRRGGGRHKGCQYRRVEGIGDSEREARRGQAQGLPLLEIEWMGESEQEAVRGQAQGLPLQEG